MWIKLVTYLGLNLASVLGISQAFIKLFKEIVTAVINLLFPIIPNAKFQSIVLKIRELINTLDKILEKIKGFALKKTV